MCVCVCVYTKKYQLGHKLAIRDLAPVAQDLHPSQHMSSFTWDPCQLHYGLIVRK